MVFTLPAPLFDFICGIEIVFNIITNQCPTNEKQNITNTIFGFAGP